MNTEPAPSTSAADASSKYAVGDSSIESNSTSSSISPVSIQRNRGAQAHAGRQTTADLRKRTNRSPTSFQDEDLHPTYVTKKPCKHTKILKSSLKKGLTWGEEAKKLSSLVRTKYSCIEEEGKLPNVTQNQLKLLYLICQYSFASENHLEEECWIRRIPILVLVYEGIIAQVFDYDYAPSLEVFQSNRVYMNITQEGKDDLDDLRQHGLIDALTLASSEYDQCLAYTIVKEKAKPVLATMKKEWKDQIDSLLLSPYKNKKITWDTASRPCTRDELLLEVFWNESFHRFEIVSHSGYNRTSTVTDIEDVSYVCSPCIPDCLRPSKRHARIAAPRNEIQRNTSIAEQAVQFIKTHASDNIQDELDEVLKANEVKVFVAEWIPFGSNQMANLNDKLGSVERVQGGLFSAFMDDNPDGTRFAHAVSSTGHQVQILDYDLTEFVNFTADIFFEEDEGIIQIEEFGVSIQKDGSIMYGLQVESVLDRLHDNISMDHLSRLLVDIIQDSSHVAHHLLSAYQRTMLNVLFADRPTLRPKYRIIVCEDLDPMMVSIVYLLFLLFLVVILVISIVVQLMCRQAVFLIIWYFPLSSLTCLLSLFSFLLSPLSPLHYKVADKYMDKEDFENELKQVIGNTRSGHDLGPREVIIFGRDGLVVAGKRVERLNDVLVAYSQLEARDLILRVFFRRIFQLDDVIKETRRLIVNYEKAPGSMRRTRTLLTKTERDLIILAQLLQYVTQSLEDLTPPPPPDPNDVGAVTLADLIQYKRFRQNLSDRATDMFKNCEGLTTSMKALYMLTDANAEAEMFRMVQAQVTNGKNLEDTMKAGERSSSSLEVMNGILAGSLAFDLIDRLTTLYASFDHEEEVLGTTGAKIAWQSFWTFWVWVARIPGAWLVLNLVAWGLLFLYITTKMRTLARNANGALQCRLTVNTKIDLESLTIFLSNKRLINEDSDSTKHTHTRSVSWQEENKEEWKDKPPLIEIHYDVTHSYLLMVHLDVEQNYGCVCCCFVVVVALLFADFCSLSLSLFILPGLGPKKLSVYVFSIC